MKFYNTITILLMTALVLFISCGEDFLDRYPTDTMAKSKVFASVEGVKALKVGLYRQIGGPGETMYQFYLSLLGGIAGNDMVFGNRNLDSFFPAYNYRMTKIEVETLDLWKKPYGAIEITNTITENETKVIRLLGEKEGKSYIAEAKAIRAMAMYDVSRFYGKAYHLDKGASKSMPYLTTVQKLTDQPKRNTMKEIFDLAIKDLTEAIPHLKDAHSIANKKLMNKNAAHAVLSRIYLDMHDYKKAKKHAQDALNGITLLLPEEYRLGLSKISKETILGFTLHKINAPSFEENSFQSLHDVDFEQEIGNAEEFVVNSSLFDIIGDDDLRKHFFISQQDYHQYDSSLQWKIDNELFESAQGEVGYYHYGKFPRKDVKMGIRNTGTLGLGDHSYIRGAEIVLTLAECQARLGENTEAQANLDKVRKRSIPTAPTSTKTGQALVDEILLERRKELFAEGHEYRDILRLGKGLRRDGSHQQPQISLKAGDPRFQWPVPQAEVLVNPNLKD